MEESTREPIGVSPEVDVKREELTEYLRSRLIESGWRDQLSTKCRELIQKRGVDNVKLVHLISEVRTEARQKISESIRTEMLGKIRKLAQETTE